MITDFGKCIGPNHNKSLQRLMCFWIDRYPQLRAIPPNNLRGFASFCFFLGGCRSERLQIEESIPRNVSKPLRGGYVHEFSLYEFLRGGNLRVGLFHVFFFLSVYCGGVKVKVRWKGIVL